MCGILGIVGRAAKGKDLNPSLNMLAHRGPDNQAVFESESALLGHVRLSIIDTSPASHQPMHDPSGRYTLVFNGEIYNYRTIAESLRSQGVEFQTQSDTEVLLHLLIHKGITGLDELNGFFAFAFYDNEQKEVIIARDRLGIKPLFYSHQEESLYFSSEFAPLEQLLPAAAIDREALALYLQFNFIAAPRSIQNQIEQLMPGEYAKFKSGKLEKGRYHSISRPEQVNHKSSLQALLEDAVQLRMISDVPLGSFLSGGVDSSIIAALAAKSHPGLQTFSIGFSDHPHFDESQYAERVASHIGSSHRTIDLKNDDMLEHVEALLSSMREPFADSSAIAVHALSHHTRKHVTVALSGDGADELFGGYNKHQAHLLAQSPDAKAMMARLVAPMLSWNKGGHASAMGNRLRKLQRFEAGRKLAYKERYLSWASWTSEAEVRDLFGEAIGIASTKELLKHYLPQDDSLEEVLRSDTRFVLPNDMLKKVDRMSMANSLEVRVPFLDHRVVELAMNMSAKERFGKDKGKLILRQEFADLLPSDIFTRSKKGFEVPLEDWFNGPLHTQVIGVLSDDILRSLDLFKTSAIEVLLSRIKDKNIAADVHLIWAFMVLHAYLKGRRIKG